MISDFDSNFVYISGLLPERFPSFFKELIAIFKNARIEYGLLQNTKDIWCRDYMPIQVNEDKYVSFRYEPGYLMNNEWRETISDTRLVCQGINIDPIYSDIKLDGGNIVRHKEKVIVTEKIYSENPTYERKKLLNELEHLLEVETIIIPCDPYDITGHADGMVKFLSDTLVLVNDYSKENTALGGKIKSELKKHGIETMDFHYCPDATLNKWGDYTAKGLYINYLQVAHSVILPSFNLESDGDAMVGLYSTFPPVLDVSNIECSDLAMEGGVLNCISWTIQKDCAIAPPRPSDWRNSDGYSAA